MEYKLSKIIKKCFRSASLIPWSIWRAIGFGSCSSIFPTLFPIGDLDVPPCTIPFFIKNYYYLRYDIITYLRYHQMWYHIRYYVPRERFGLCRGAGLGVFFVNDVIRKSPARITAAWPGSPGSYCRPKWRNRHGSPGSTAVGYAAVPFWSHGRSPLNCSKTIFHSKHVC